MLQARKPFVSIMSRFLTPLVAILFLTAPSAPLSAQSTTSAPAVVTRADLAWRYLLMDAAYTTADSAGRLTDSTRVALNRLFDRSTLSFFGGRFATTAAMMDSAITMADPTYRFERRVVPQGVMIDGRPARAAREALLARLATLDSTGPLAQAITSARSRALLLVDSVSPERSAEFLADPPTLARAVTAEIDALMQGRNPYARALTDVWRSYRGANGTVVPMRISAPQSAATQPVGVLIVLHGAGGDENMFANGYGQGIAARLAREQELLFVSPATTPFMTSAVQFDSLMAVLRREYRLDESRVYVLGHSMGAGAAARLAQERPRALAAVVCLAGGAPVTTADAPPVLFLGAQLDPIIPAARVQAAAAATPSGTYEELANEGHTLMVRDGVKRGLAWMVQHVRR